MKMTYEAFASSTFLIRFCEIGRNYGKAISNSLMDDSHSTPVRMVSGDVSNSEDRFCYQYN